MYIKFMDSLIRVLLATVGLFLFSVSNPSISCKIDIDIDVENKVQQIAFDKTDELDVGARIKVRLTSRSKCYAVVFWRDSQGEVFNLISNTTQNHSGLLLVPGAIHLLPEDGWYQLDNQSGTETIVLATSSQPIEKLGELGLLLASQELETFSSISGKRGLSVSWKTIEHRVTDKYSGLRFPDNLNQIQTVQPPIDDVLIPRQPDIPLIRHAQQIERLSKVTETSVRRGTQSLFDQVAPAVVHIYHYDGTGSGVIVDRRGLIVTNYHVVKGHPDVAVSLKNTSESDFSNTRVYIAKVVRRSETHDLALLKLGDIPNDLAVMPLGDIDDVEMGMTVHAIGHPEGLLWSYTKGIVSQVRRNHVWNDHMADIIQTQTPINPGNSGGPLFDDNGQVIGINAAMRGDGTVGLNIAISVDHVKELLGKYVSRSPSPSFLPLSIRNSAFKSTDSNTNGVPDIFCFDRNKNQFVDICAIDEDENGEADYWLLDQNENGEIDGRIYKTGGDTPIYIFDFDYDEDGKLDLTGYDLDSDGEVDTYTRHSD
jgi:S1-C subfamily serine protease